MSEKGIDPAVADLARYFLVDEGKSDDEALVCHLAETIQSAVEDWFFARENQE